MRVVDLADRYHLTTVEALELCHAAGIAAEGSDTELDDDEADRWVELADQQREWRERNEQERLARVGTTSGRGPSAASAAGDGAPSLGIDGSGDFGPIPPPPWEAGGAAASNLPAAAPLVTGDRTELSGWGATAPSAGQPQISPLAPAALAFGTLSLIFPFVAGLIGFGLGHVAKNRIRASSGKLTGERMATAGQVLSVIGIILWSALLGYAFYTDYQHTQQRAQFTDLQVDEGVIQWNELAPHQCLRVPRAEVGVQDWQRVSCASPHEAEVFSVQTVNQANGSAYPGRASFVPLAKEVCEPAFAAYVGVPYAESSLRMGAAFPSISNWVAENDRHVACIAFQEDWDYINGSLEGAKR